jgi:hypothetical protein
MATEWYYSRGSEKLGPISSPELRELAALGQLQPTDLVWKEGFADWIAASRVKDLVFAKAMKAPLRQTPPRNGDAIANAANLDESLLDAERPVVPSVSPIRVSQKAVAPRYPNLHRYLSALSAVAYIILIFGCLIAVAVAIAGTQISDRLLDRLVGVLLAAIILANAIATYIALMALVEFIRVIMDIEFNTRMSADHLQYFRTSPSG